MPTIILNAEMSYGAAQNSMTCASRLRDRARRPPTPSTFVRMRVIAPEQPPHLRG